MDLEKIEKQLQKFSNDSENIEESAIKNLVDKYFRSNEKIEIISPNYDYEFLCQNHKKLFKLLKKVKNDSSLNGNTELHIKIVKLKLKYDRLIVMHPLYKKAKFEQKFLLESGFRKSPDDYIIYKGKYKKSFFLNELFDKLIPKHIDEMDKKNFKRLFSNLKVSKLENKIVWKTDLVELRAFFDVLSKDLKIIKLPNQNDNFIQNHFLDSNKHFIEKSYFANLSSRKVNYQDFHNKWMDRLELIE